MPPTGWAGQTPRGGSASRASLEPRSTGTIPAASRRPLRRARHERTPDVRSPAAWLPMSLVGAERVDEIRELACVLRLFETRRPMATAEPKHHLDVGPADFARGWPNTRHRTKVTRFALTALERTLQALEGVLAIVASRSTSGKWVSVQDTQRC